MPAILSGYLQHGRIQAVIPYLHGDVLDLGCGDGSLAASVEPGHAYVGVDGRAGLMPTLRARFPAYEFHCRDLDREPLALGKRFHTIAALALVEHLSRPGWMLGQLVEHLLPGGRVVITTPSPIGNRIHQAGARIGLFSVAAMQEHKTIFTRDTLSDCLWQNGLRVSLFKPFLFGGNQLFVSEARSPAGG
jgi:2-polyprenyl-3-methyl-5-hydroxy-6-metoxy-1,4-benzoquinol methylase